MADVASSLRARVNALKANTPTIATPTDPIVLSSTLNSGLAGKFDKMGGTLTGATYGPQFCITGTDAQFIVSSRNSKTDFVLYNTDNFFRIFSATQGDVFTIGQDGSVSSKLIGDFKTVLATKVSIGYVDAFDVIPIALQAAIINGTSQTFVTSYINQILATGANVFLRNGTYQLGDVKLQFTRQGQKLIGQDYFNTILNMDYRISGFNTSIDEYVGLVHHASISDIKFQQYQSSTATRSTIIAYPPIMKPGNAYQVKFTNVRFESTYYAINGTGNNTFMLENVHFGILYRGLVMDGSLDFSRLDGVYFWPYGMGNSVSLMLAYYDGTAKALDIGHADGFNCTNLNVFSIGVRFWGGTDGFGAGANIANLYMDANYATLEVSGGTITIGSLTSTKSLISQKPDNTSNWNNVSQRSISINGGSLTIGTFQTNAYGGDAQIVQTGGQLSIGAGDLFQQHKDYQGIYIVGGDAFFGSGFTMRGRPGEARTQPFGVQDATGGLHYMGSIKRSEGDSGLGLFFTTDTYNNYCNQTNLSRWPVQLNFSNPTKGYYQ